MRTVAALMMVALLGACATTEYNPTPGGPVYPAYHDEVRVLPGFPPEGSYDSVGIVVAYGVDLNDKEDLIEALRSEAAKRGANAIVLQGDIKLRSSRDRNEKVLGAYALRLKP